MSLELYNMTKDTKTVPKFRYNGKYVIPSHGTVDINEETAFFFKPYASIGVVVRTKIEPDNEDVVKGVGVEEVKEEVVISETSETKETVVEEVKEEAVEETVKSNTDKTIYSEDELSFKNYKSLKKIATDLGLDVENVNKKADLIRAILESQK